ncbi:MAG: response regulator [Chloroflexota bacterium]
MSASGGNPGGAFVQPSGRPRIAVLNDDPAFLELMHMLLEQTEGYEVRVLAETSGSHEILKDWRPDLVILDLVMGQEEAGWKVLELLTLDPSTSAIPVIICSAATQSLKLNEDRLKEYRVGVLPKPFDLEALLAKVETALQSPRP